jgi:hypothetical protein
VVLPVRIKTSVVRPVCHLPQPTKTRQAVRILPSGSLRCVVGAYINVLEGHPASIFNPRNGGIVFLGNVGIQP